MYPTWAFFTRANHSERGTSAICTFPSAVNALARASKNIGSCIGWVVQNPQHIMVLYLSPHNFSLMRPTSNPPRKEQMFLVKVANGRKSRSGMLKAVKDLANGGLHLQIRVKNNGVAFG